MDSPCQAVKLELIQFSILKYFSNTGESKLKELILQIRNTLFINMVIHNHAFRVKGLNPVLCVWRLQILPSLCGTFSDCISGGNWTKTYIQGDWHVQIVCSA